MLIGTEFYIAEKFIFTHFSDCTSRGTEKKTFCSQEELVHFARAQLVVLRGPWFEDFTMDHDVANIANIGRCPSSPYILA